MGSPFPGMDPFLEGDLWQEFHSTLAGQIRAQLLPKLAPRYVALLAKRYVIDVGALGLFESQPRSFYPDVHVLREVAPPLETAQGGVLVATRPTIELANAAPVPQLSIEIRDIAERRLVTVIEILSPSNKHGEGAREYARRRYDLLASLTSQLEIDLLRLGQRIELHGAPPPAPYYVYLTRSTNTGTVQVWAVQLPQRLPVVPVPLLDPDVLLDLQAAVDDCFTLVGYQRLLDYAAPLPPFDEADRTWVADRLAA